MGWGWNLPDCFRIEEVLVNLETLQNPLQQSHDLILAGAYREALEALHAHPAEGESVWWRLRGLARWYLGDTGGLADVQHSAHMEQPGAGWAWQDVGGLLFLKGDWAGAIAALRRALAHFEHEQEALGAAWALHGLGVAHLHQGSYDEGLRYGEEAWALVRRRALRGFYGRVLVLLSDLHRVRGELAEALERARQALGHRLEVDDEVLALRALGTSLRLLGKPDEATLKLNQALLLAPQGVRRAAILIDQAHAEAARGNTELARLFLKHAEPALEAHAPARCRAWVLHGALAWEQGRPTEARRYLQKALEVGPYPLAEEARAWPALFDWGREKGLKLPQPQQHETKAPVRLKVNGVRELWIGERQVPLGGSGKAFDLLVYLALEGPHHWEQVGCALWEGEAPQVLYTRLKATLSRARDLLAQREAVRMERGILSLDPTRAWQVDKSGPGRFLEGLWTEWALERREN